MSIEAMKQALEALIQARKIRFALWRRWCECRDEHTCNPLQDEYAKQFNDSIIKLEQAIADLEKQEPVAWGNLANWCLDSDRVLITDKEAAEKYHRDVYDLTPLYPHPQPKEKQEPTSNVEALRHSANEWADMASNGLQWVRNIAEGISTPQDALINLEANLAHCREVNDHPDVQVFVRNAQPKREPLTDEQIVRGLEAAGVEFNRFMGGAGGNKDIWTTSGSQSVQKIAVGVRGLLAAHGIKEKNND